MEVLKYTKKFLIAPLSVSEPIENIYSAESFVFLLQMFRLVDFPVGVWLLTSSWKKCYILFKYWLFYKFPLHKKAH